jgi:hypothetical protein
VGVAVNKPLSHLHVHAPFRKVVAGQFCASNASLALTDTEHARFDMAVPPFTAQIVIPQARMVLA